MMCWDPVELCITHPQDSWSLGNSNDIKRRNKFQIEMLLRHLQSSDVD